MAQAYFKGVKRMEGMVGMFNGMVTLPRIADVYEALGRFLKDMNLLSEVLMLSSCGFVSLNFIFKTSSTFSGAHASAASAGDSRVIVRS